MWLFLRDKGASAFVVQVSTSPIKRVKWSNTHRSLCFILDAGGGFYIYDFALLGPKSAPIAHATCYDAASGGGTASVFALSKEERETRVAIGYEKGDVEVHLFKESLIAFPSKRNENWL